MEVGQFISGKVYWLKWNDCLFEMDSRTVLPKKEKSGISHLLKWMVAFRNGFVPYLRPRLPNIVSEW